MAAYLTSGVHLDFLEAPWPLSPASAPTLACGVCDDHLTGLAGLSVMARLARFLGLPEQLVPLRAQACGQRWGSVPVCGDGPGSEVEGQLCENAERGCHGEQQSRLPSVCVGAAGVSARLHAGGTDVQGDGREQLDQDAVPCLAGRQPVGLRAASAYFCGELGSYCRRKGWDDSVSVTGPRKKAPILRLAAARGLREDEGEPLDAAGQERALAVAHRPARGPEEPVCGVLRSDGDGEQRLLEPVCTVIPVSRDRLPLAELVRRHRGQQGPEHALKGPLTDLGLQHPPCRSHAAHQGFCLGGQIAQQLLRLLPCQVLPSEARQHGLQPLIRYFASSVGRLRSRSNLRLDWLLHAASQMEPGQGWGGAAGAAPSGRGPTRSPREDRCARSPVRRALRSSHTAPQPPFREINRESRRSQNPRTTRPGRIAMLKRPWEPVRQRYE